MTADYCRLNDVSSWEVLTVRCPECGEHVPADEAELHATDHILDAREAGL